MIKNKTRDRVLAENLEIADTPGKRSRGLMFRRALPEDTGMLLVTGNEARTGIWMLAMRFPIDIIFISKDKRVVDIVRSAQPVRGPSTWKIYRPKKPAKYVLEVGEGKAGRTGTRIGDVLEF